MKRNVHTVVSRLSHLALVALVVSPITLIAQESAPAGPPPAAGSPGEARGGHPHGAPAERQAHMLAMMTRKLNLSPDQAMKIRDIQNDSRTQMEGVRSDGSVQGPDRRAKMMDIHKAQQEKVRAVLNEEQRTKYDAMEANHGRHDGEGREHKPSSANPPA